MPNPVNPYFLVAFLVVVLKQLELVPLLYLNLGSVVSYSFEYS